MLPVTGIVNRKSISKSLIFNFERGLFLSLWHHFDLMVFLHYLLYKEEEKKRVWKKNRERKIPTRNCEIMHNK